MFSDKSPNAELKLIDFGLSKVYFFEFPSFPPDPHRQPIHPQRCRYAQLHRPRSVHARLPRLRLHEVLRHVVSRHHLLFPAHRPQPASLAALHRSPPAAPRQDPLPPEILEFHFSGGQTVRRRPAPVRPREAAHRSALGGRFIL